MKGIDGLYTALNSIIAQREEDMHIAMGVDDIVEQVKYEVDIHSASLDWYVMFALKAATQIALHQKGYRAVVKGTSIFVNADNCINPNYLARLFNNAKFSEEQKRQAVNKIRSAIKRSGMEGQLSFDEAGTIYEDVSEKQLVEMLRKDAEEKAI